MMRDIDSYLEKITDSKDKLYKGKTAAHRAEMLLWVIEMSIFHGTYGTVPTRNTIEGEELFIPSYYHSLIHCSSRNSAGLITIPGLFLLCDEISDTIPIITGAIEEGINNLKISHTSREVILCDQLYAMRKLMRDPDFIHIYPDLDPFKNENKNDPHSPSSLISMAKSILDEMIQNSAPHKEYGAYCFLIESADRYLVRSFMQGINQLLSSDNNSIGPTVLVFRKNDSLIFGFFSDEHFHHYYVIEIKSLDISIKRFEIFSQFFSVISRLSSLPAFEYRKQYVCPDQKDVCDQSHFLTESGVCHARSYDDMMQILSDTGYHLSSHYSDTVYCGRSAG